jgi:hypothetical protein
VKLVAGFAPAELNRGPEVLLWRSTLRLSSAFVDANRKEPDIARRAHRRRAEWEAFLRARLLPDETVVAQRRGVVVTDRRVLFAWEGYPSSWRSDAVGFQEVTRWSVGRRHDERPLLRLEHPPHLRPEQVAAHHFLWFAWGDTEAEVPHDHVTLAFGSSRDEAFQAVIARLDKTDIPRGEDFLVSLPGTREERTRGSQAYLSRL